MRHWRAWLVGAAGAALATTLALAQVTGLFPTNLNGQETWEVSVGGPQAGVGEFFTTNIVRGGSPDTVLSAVSGSFTIGVACGNCTQLGTPLLTSLGLSGGNVLITAQPAAATITLPPNPILDGAIVGVCNASAAAWATNVVTLAANTSQTLATSAALTTQAQGTCARAQWNQSQATWYRIQ